MGAKADGLCYGSVAEPVSLGADYQLCQEAVLGGLVSSPARSLASLSLYMLFVLSFYRLPKHMII